MRKSSKVISLALSGLMATSCFSMVAASAAQVDADSTGVMTAAERQAAGHQLVFFRFPSSAWGDNANVKYNAKKHTCNVFCNYYAYYGNKGEVKESAWEAPSTSMYKDAKGDSLYYFDITESGKGELEEGADYGVLFSTKANAGQADLLQPNTDGYQTCDMYFNTTCLGTTYHIVEPASKATVRENTANSQKIDYLGTNDAAGQSVRKVSTLCAYIDGAKAGNSPDALEMANALQTYLPNSVNEPSFTWAKIKPVIEKFGASAQDVYDLYVEKYGAKHDEGVQYVHVDGADDLKADGTLKDCYRYTSITTKEIDEATGVEKEKVTKYPDFDLVRERLNLPDEPVVVDIDSVAAAMDGEVKATEALPTVAGIVGGNYASEAVWSPADEIAAYNTEYTLTVTFTADEGYQFTDATTATLNDKAFDKVELADGKLVATATFKTEDEPVPADTFVVAGTPADIFGTAWDATNEDNLMTANDDGTYTKDYTVDKAFDVVQLKAVKNGADWYGDETGNNATFALTGAGTFTVTAAPTEDGYVVSVSGDNVADVVFEVGTVYAVGNGEGTWLNGAAWDPAFASNEMTEVAEGVWEIEFANVPDGFERQIKFAIDGAWTHNFGAPKEDVPEFESGVTFDATYDGGNITFDTDDVCTVKAQLDLREFDFITKEGAKFTVTIDYAPVEAVGIIGDVNGDGNVTIDDATLIQQRGIELVKFDEVQEKLGDVNRDGRISILDVTCVQKYLADYTEGTGEAGNLLLADGRIVPADQ